MIPVPYTSPDLHDKIQLLEELTPKDEKYYKARAVVAVKRYRRNRNEFIGHLVGYGVVNAAIFGVWLALGRGFPWFLLVAAGWGVGLSLNAFMVWRSRSKMHQAYHDYQQAKANLNS